MRPFAGFPANTRYAAIPAAFLSDLLPQIADEAELRVSLHLFWLLSQKRGRPRAVLRSALLADAALAQSLPDGAAAERGLKAAVARGTFLSAPVTVAGAADAVYLVNTAANQRELALIAAGRLPVEAGQPARAPGAPSFTARVKDAPPAAPRPNIFQLYEENIGLLTPLLAEELRAAEARYPAAWVEAAFRLAVERNRRRWSYIAAILERWAAEGFPGTSGESLAIGSGPTRASVQDTFDGYPGRHPTAKASTQPGRGRPGTAFRG